MMGLRKWWKRRGELDGIEERRRELEQTLKSELGQTVRLLPAAAKGGYDEIFYAETGGRRIAVVRVNSPLKTQDDPIGRHDPGVPLDANQRIAREWNAYQILSKEDLSPRPLWLGEDAMACSWLAGERLSRLLARERNQFWPMMELLFPLISRMHALGVCHLDLNLGNVWVSPERDTLRVIDFEFGPVPWVSLGQQKGFDYLRVIDDSLKKRRGGDLLRNEPGRLVRILDQSVAGEARDADLGFVFHKLKRLEGEQELRSVLRQVFRQLT